MNSEPTLTGEQRAEWDGYLQLSRSALIEHPRMMQRFLVETIIAVDERLTFLEAERTRLVEHAEYLLKDRNEWQAACTDERKRHDKTIQERQAAMATTATLRAELAQARAEQRRGEEALRPTVVCLCGSTRFWETFQSEGLRLTLEGKIVLSIGICAPDSMVLAHPESVEGKRQKAMLDDLHKRKIDLADEVLILNVDGYIGDSTRSELAYAQAHGKRVRWLNAALASSDAPTREAGGE